ncbi:hypothetical protein ACFSOZ_16200 [Mesorhizobium newzealandense]|uniref:Twin-arginine translocation signal domain-containing protein n=1 Tax=Mesorhizobium newzealandense TaxID=1300302 RepID=A0ABW4UCB9_9HYPH
MNAHTPIVKPYGCPQGVDPRTWRQSIETRLNDLLDRAMALITALDMMEVDCDLEETADDEPSLGCVDDLELDNCDLEDGVDLEGLCPGDYGETVNVARRSGIAGSACEEWNMNTLSRRHLLRKIPMGLAAVALPAVFETPVPSTDLTAIPSDAVEKIKAWQAAHRENVRATNAYSASLRVTPIDKPECDRRFHAMVASQEPVGPSREAMIMALWRI